MQGEERDGQRAHAGSVTEEEVRLELLRALRRLHREQASTSEVLALDLMGIADVLDVEIERLRGVLSELLLEGYAQEYAATFGKPAEDGACRITGAGLQELRHLERSRDEPKVGRPRNTHSLERLVHSPHGSEHEIDFFISHASEDKEGFVRALAQRLRELGLAVWYDEFALKPGDSLRRSIEKGLATARFGLVVLSHNFFAKKWPQTELNGLFAREIAGTRVIIPIWHEITHADVLRHAPMLADKFALQSSAGAETVARKLLEVIEDGRAERELRGESDRLPNEAEAPTKARRTSGDTVEAEYLEELSERAEERRAERLRSVLQRDTPTPLIPDVPILLVHLFPDAALTRRSAVINLDRIQKASLAPLFAMGGFQTGRNFAGYLSEYGDRDGRISYLQIYRNGVLESAAVLRTQGQTDTRIPGDWYEQSVVRKFPSYLKALEEAGTQPPILLTVSLVGVRGYSIRHSDWMSERARGVDRDILDPYPEVLKSFDQDLPATLKPAFDAIWNASGHQQSSNYDENGAWRPRMSFSY